jgi:hypothetical protein
MNVAKLFGGLFCFLAGVCFHLALSDKIPVDVMTDATWTVAFMFVALLCLCVEES